MQDRRGRPPLDARRGSFHAGAPKRWDGRRVEDFEGTYGAYLISKVSKVFPELAGKTGVDGVVT